MTNSRRLIQQHVKQKSLSFSLSYLILSFSLVSGFYVSDNYHNDNTSEKSGFVKQFSIFLKNMNDFQGAATILILIPLAILAVIISIVTGTPNSVPPNPDPIMPSSLPPTPPVPDHSPSNQNYISKKQLDIIKNEISEVVNELKTEVNQLEKKYFKDYDGQNKVIFFDNQIEELKESEYGQMSNISDIGKYIYILDNDCNFYGYPYYPYMDRHDTQILETCQLLQENEKEEIFTSVYPSTGTQTFVASYGKTIDIDNDGVADIVLVMAADLEGISERIHNSFLPDFEGQVIIVDRNGNMLTNCSDECDNLEVSFSGITEYTQPKQFPSDFDSSLNHLSEKISGTTSDYRLSAGYSVHIFYK